VIYLNYDIVSVPDLEPQVVEDAVLKNVITLKALLNTGTDFYIGSITTKIIHNTVIS
jgi:hypothetical protein